MERKSTISETAVACASIQARSCGIGETVGELDLGIATEQARRLAGEALLDRGAHRSDGGDGGDTERQAGDENAEPGEAAAELAQREADRKRQPRPHGSGLALSQRKSGTRVQRSILARPSVSGTGSRRAVMARPAASKAAA